MSDALITLTSYPDHDTALKAASVLVQKKLAACVNVLPQVTSVYEWKGEAKTETEHLLLVKTTVQRFDALKAAIIDTHPYELPEIIATPITRGLQDYIDWIGAQTTP